MFPSPPGGTASTTSKERFCLFVDGGNFIHSAAPGARWTKTGTTTAQPTGDEREVGVGGGNCDIFGSGIYMPARKKFLKQPATEGGYVQDFVEKIALSRPDISIRYLKGGSSVLHTSGNHNLKDIIYQIYGRELTANLIPVEVTQGPVQISGYICKPIVARSNRTCETYFINGRYIKNPLISKAIEEAYRPFLMKHKFPFTVLHLTIDTQSLDG